MSELLILEKLESLEKQSNRMDKKVDKIETDIVLRHSWAGATE